VTKDNVFVITNVIPKEPDPAMAMGSKPVKKRHQAVFSGALPPLALQTNPVLAANV